MPYNLHPKVKVKVDQMITEILQDSDKKLTALDVSKAFPLKTPMMNAKRISIRLLRMWQRGLVHREFNRVYSKANLRNRNVHVYTLATWTHGVLPFDGGAVEN